MFYADNLHTPTCWTEVWAFSITLKQIPKHFSLSDEVFGLSYFDRFFTESVSWYPTTILEIVDLAITGLSE